MAIQIGEMRNQLALDLRRTLEHIINEHKKLDNYYVLAIARPGEKRVETKIVLMLHRPPKLIGTICWHVDNRKGKLMRLWVLPYDWKWPEFVEGELLTNENHPEIESIDKGILESMGDMPIIMQ
jgi:hypothetical protein